jgi:hypothetical protein
LNPTVEITFEYALNNISPEYRKWLISNREDFEVIAELASRRNVNDGPSAPVEKDYKPIIPLSESPGNKFKRATAEDCVDDLRRIAKENPEKVITRNFYRLNGKYPESCFSKHFGTFHEFKRRAGIVLTRQQHALEKDIAKHAANDQYRALNVECREYAEKYLKPRGNRWQTILGFADVHDVNADAFVLRVLLDTAERVQPDVVCINGDLFDLPEFSKYTVDPRSWNVVSRVKFAHEKVLQPLRKACPDAQIDLIGGNHEFRLMRHLQDATPALRAVLADLHGFTISKLLGLDQFQVNLISRGDLAAFTSSDIKTELKKNYKAYFGAVLATHEPDGAGSGMPGFCGHHHKFVAWPCKSAVYGAYNFYQIGGICRRAATYTDGENWSNGFMLIHVDTQTRQSIFEYVPVGDFAVVGGKYYFRQRGEV